jgi:MFS transporter, putative metabolite:H+ symporter
VDASPAKRRRNPWWIPPFLGRVPDVEDRHLQVLGFVALGLFFESFDLSLLSNALKHISEGLDIDPQRELAFYLGAVRIGGLLAFLLLPLADRVGRRRIYLVSLIGMSVFTLATAFAQTPGQLVMLQMAGRVFIATLSAVGVVMLAEELPAQHRGWGIGMLGALSACGHGAGAALFAAVDVLPGGWRALYVVGALPLVFLPFFRRTIQETARFTEHRASGAAESGGALTMLRSLARLARSNPRRAALVGTAGMLQALGAISVFQFASLFVQTEHGWAPWQLTVMVLGAGALGIIGNVVAGRLGDSVGRRIVGAAAFFLFPIAAIGFYNGPGWALPLCFVAIVFASSAGEVIVRAFSTELFPTSQRGASAGWLTLLQTIGWIAGLWLVGAGTWLDVPLPRMISVVALGVAGAGLLLLLLPETRARELEELSTES